jgi:hypothetical protein
VIRAPLHSSLVKGPPPRRQAPGSHPGTLARTGGARSRIPAPASLCQPAPLALRLGLRDRSALVRAARAVTILPDRRCARLPRSRLRGLAAPAPRRSCIVPAASNRRQGARGVWALETR